MGRLIDADALLDRISLNYNNHQNISAGAMKDIINIHIFCFLQGFEEYFLMNMNCGPRADPMARQHG
jgi:hypothetical protein